jgi:hypothetical protein
MTNTADTTTPAIEAFSLTKVYGSGNTEVVAMKDVSLAVRRGEVVALLGPQRRWQIHPADGHWPHQSAYRRTDRDRWTSGDGG